MGEKIRKAIVHKISTASLEVLTRRKMCRVMASVASLVVVFMVAAIAMIAVAADDPELILSPAYGPTTGGTSVTLTRTPNWSGQEISYSFSGGTQTFTAPVTGRYKLEVWGAQGGGDAAGSANGSYGGKGGYSSGEVTLTEGQVVHIGIGGQGGAATGGYNGGGSVLGGAGWGGGGATHMALATGLLTTFNSNRGQVLIVAGGGGGGQNKPTSSKANCVNAGGGAGGGVSGTDGTCSGNNNGRGGTQTAGGGGGTAGTFGAGGSSSKSGGSDYGGGGGGGFMGGGSGAGGRGGGGGGGSGYVGNPLMSNGVTVAGTNSFVAPDGTTVTGHEGNGYARITILEEGLYSQPNVYFDGVLVPVTSWTRDSVTVTAPAHANGAVEVWVEGDEEAKGIFNYWVAATNYTNECTTDGGLNWDTFYYVDAATPVSCRVTVNDTFDGTIRLSDDYYNTVAPGLTGSFSSSDTRFNAATRTFTLTRADTLGSAGRELYYTYTSPTWNRLVPYYDESNHDDLFWPGIEVVVTPTVTAQPITATTDPVFFGLWAETYEIIPDNPYFAVGFESNFTISTYGAPYEGVLTLDEDIRSSSDPNGQAGDFRPASRVIDFANSQGADVTFYYTPQTAAIGAQYIEICGNSSRQVIMDTCYSFNVATPSMSLTGPTQLGRGETGVYTLTLDIAQIGVSFGGIVDIDELIPGGIFIDTSGAGGNPTGTFDPTTNVYTFTRGASGETYERTFTYTMPQDMVGQNTTRLTATADNDEQTFINILLTADRINFGCSAAYPNCHEAFVGESQDYTVRPNGIFTGAVQLGSIGNGSYNLGTNYNWVDHNSAISVSYTPNETGRHDLSATVSGSTTQSMNGQTYYTSDPESLDDYVWVMANQMSIVGDDQIANAGNGYFTLTMNGPYNGNIYLEDTMGGVAQGGSFSNGGVCSLSFADYRLDTNTTSCTFMYTPTVVAINRSITLTPKVASSYKHVMATTAHTTYVHGFPQISGVSPDEGPSTGGTTIYISGVNLGVLSFVTLDGLLCTNLNLMSDTAISCQTPARGAGTVDVVANGNEANSFPYTYFNLATDYVNECSVDGGTTWESFPYVDPGTEVSCRIVLNGRFQGVISIIDDYYDTIGNGLTGTFASQDQRFYSDEDGNYFTVGYSDTADETGRTFNYTYTSPSWETLETHYQSDGSTDDDLYWPLIEVDVTTSEGETLTSTSDDVVFGLYAQEYFFSTNGTYDYYCVGCEAGFIVSTHGAPFEGTITMSEDLSSSDNPGGTAGVFSAANIAGNDVMDFAGLDGTNSGGGYTPMTTATGGNYIRLCGTSSDPAITDACINITNVISSGVSIVPVGGNNMLGRGQTGTYLLTVTIGNDWDGTVQLSDVFSTGSAGGGSFADASSGSDPTGTYNAATKTYTFTSGVGETYRRTFSYTMRDDSVVGPLFPSYVMQLKGISSVPENLAYLNVNIEANRVLIRCASGYPNCTTGYVGNLKDYSYLPNGMMVGSADVTASDAGSLGELTWNTAAAFSMSYTPTAPGRQRLTVSVTDSTNPTMIGQDYYSTDPDSLDDYIWVMADSMRITGPTVLKSGASGTYTLTLNGPFVGTISLDDFINEEETDGVFPNGSSCTFGLGDYDTVTNTSSCSFVYSPLIYDDGTVVDLTPSIADYAYALELNPISVLVYGKPIIISIDPEMGPTIGGNVMTLTGENLAQNDRITVGNILIDPNDIIEESDDVISFVAPPNSAGPVDIAVMVGMRTYHHPDIYTYIPSLSSITPVIGPTTGGTGFGVSYDENGVATITGNDLSGSGRYSDGTEQYYGLEYLEFNGLQYIDTGVGQLGNTKMTIDMTRDSEIAAAGVATANNYFMIVLTDDGFKIPSARYGNSLDHTAGGVMESGDRVLATLDANGSSASFSAYVNGVQSQSNTITPTAPPSVAHNIYLGRFNNGAGGASPGILGKVYSFAIDKDGTANDRNFVPVCSANNEGGMFDTLHNVFYPASSMLGSTPFECDYNGLTPPEIIFGGTTMVPADNINVVNPNTIEVVPPPHNEGVVDVDVIVNGITLSLENAYTYRAPLTITMVAPNSGSTEGGDTVTVVGTGFTPATTVNFGGVAATTVTYVNSTTLRAVAPAHAVGFVDVEVTGPDTQTASLVSGFEYVLLPSINLSTDKTGFTVNAIPEVGGHLSVDAMVVTTNTSWPDGYTLSVAEGLDGSNLACSEEDIPEVLPSTVTDNTSLLDMNSYGIGVGSSVDIPTVWKAVSNTPTVLTSSPVGGTFVDYVYLGARLDYFKPSCESFVGTVVYTAVTNM